MVDALRAGAAASFNSSGKSASRGGLPAVAGLPAIVLSSRHALFDARSRPMPARSTFVSRSAFVQGSASPRARQARRSPSIDRNDVLWRRDRGRASLRVGLCSLYAGRLLHRLPAERRMSSRSDRRSCPGFAPNSLASFQDLPAANASSLAVTPRSRIRSIVWRR